MFSPVVAEAIHLTKTQAFFLCNRYLTFTNFAGSLFVVFICVGWIAVWYTRWRCARKIEAQSKHNPLSFISHDLDELSSESQAKLPMVSVIMAVKGIHESSMDNWKSQLTSLYGGPMEFLFCIESENDPAYDALTAMSSSSSLRSVGDIKVCVAGLTWHCSQKIHNLLDGVATTNEKSKYILFLDDDVTMHPGTIGTLVRDLENDQRVFASGGFPFDLPTYESSLTMYLFMWFRVVNSASIASRHPRCLWGGCMMFRRSTFFENEYNIVDQWRDGGYSDDMIATSVVHHNHRLTAFHPRLIFPNLLDANNTPFAAYWRFIVRQVFVLFMHSTPFNHMLSYGLWHMLGFTSLIMFGFYFTIPQLVALFSYTVTVDNSLVQALYNLSADEQCSVHMSSLFWNATMMVTFFVVLRFYVYTIIDLCNTLSPHGARMPRPRFHWGKVLLTFFIHIFVVMAACAYMPFKKFISWGGIRYRRKGGRVVHVTHPGGVHVPLEESLARQVEIDRKRGFPNPSSYASLGKKSD